MTHGTQTDRCGWSGWGRYLYRLSSGQEITSDRHRKQQNSGFEWELKLYLTIHKIIII